MLMRQARDILVGAAWVLVFAVVAAAGEKKVVLEVKKSGGEYASVQEAVNAAPAGAVIRIGPGVYQEQVNINKPLTLDGSGWEQTAITTRSTAAEKFEMAILKFSVQMGDRLKDVQTDEERAAIMEEFAVEFGREHTTLMVADTKGVVIRGLKLSSPGKVLEGRLLPVSIVRISDAAVELSDCVIIGSPGNGIEVIDASEVEIHKCLVAAVWNSGILVRGKEGIPKTRILESDVRNCRHVGIVIRPGCNSTDVKRCRVSGSAWHGIRYDDASPTIAGNLIFGNARLGIYASGRTVAMITDNVFHKNELGGISCWANNRDVIQNNIFVGNTDEALVVLQDSEPTIRKNIFFGHTRAVLFTAGADAATGQLKSNLYWKNEADAVKRAGKGNAPEQVYEDVSDSETDKVSVDPKFGNPATKDFSLAADSPAKRMGIGTADPISFDSPWALQAEEKAIIPDSDTRDFRKWKRPGEAGDVKETPRPVEKISRFDEAIKEYKRLVKELDSKSSAYRASKPVFTKFSELCLKKVIPIIRAGEEAGRHLAEAREHGEDLDGLQYDKKAAEKVTIAILAGIYRGVYAEFQKASEAGWLSLPDEQQAVYYKACYFHFHTEEPLSEPWEKHCPYEKGTRQRDFFLRDLAQAAKMAASPLAKMVEQLPDELRQKQRRVEALYEQMAEMKGESKVEELLGPKYEEAYLKKLKDTWRKAKDPRD
jgi:nitrous oxidase accessory protein NosD